MNYTGSTPNRERARDKLQMVSLARRDTSSKPYPLFLGLGLHPKQSAIANIKTSIIPRNGINATQIRSPTVKELDLCSTTNHIHIAYYKKALNYRINIKTKTKTSETQILISFHYRGIHGWILKACLGSVISDVSLFFLLVCT